jgi:FkbM family methyltransferase
MNFIKTRTKAINDFRAKKISFWPMVQHVLPHYMRTFTELERGIVIYNQYHVELIKKNAVVVDAGANIGVFSAFAARKHPDATIYAFEPTPSTFKELQKNTAKYPNVKCFNYALGAENKMVTIVEADDYSGHNYVGEGGIPVEMKTIDSLNIPMDFLKMDTEGCEADIIKGAAKTIKKYKPVVAMSAYHKPEDKTELPKLLNTLLPYDCKLEFDVEEDFICRPILATSKK